MRNTCFHPYFACKFKSEFQHFRLSRKADTVSVQNSELGGKLFAAQKQIVTFYKLHTENNNPPKNPKGGKHPCFAYDRRTLKFVLD